MVKHAARPVLKAAHDIVFKHVHGSNLIYNCAWEDPRLDREMLARCQLKSRHDHQRRLQCARLPAR